MGKVKQLDFKKKPTDFGGDIRGVKPLLILQACV